MRDYLETISHTDFVEGYKHKKLGLVVLDYDYVTPPKFTRIFMFVALCYQWVPFLAAPIVAYVAKDWWLLLGILASKAGTRINANLPKQVKGVNQGFWLLIFLIFWYKNSFLSFGTFICFSYIWGAVWYSLADDVRDAFAGQALVDDPVLFEEAFSNEAFAVFKNEE